VQLTEDTFSDIIFTSSKQFSKFIQENVISLLKDIPSLPNIDQFIDQINPLLSSIRAQILNCSNQNTTLSSDNNNIITFIKSNLNDLFVLIDLHIKHASVQCV
jgi:hypothetical protein